MLVVLLWTGRAQAHDCVPTWLSDCDILQFVGVCMGRSEEGQPDEAMMIQVGGGAVCRNL